MRLAVVALVLSLAACGGKDDIADQVEDRAEERAAAIDNAARTMENALHRNLTEQQAEMERRAGKERAEAIRGSDLDADQLSPEQKNALVNAE